MKIILLITFCTLIILLFFLYQTVNLQNKRSIYRYVWTYFVYNYICLYNII